MHIENLAGLRADDQQPRRLMVVGLSLPRGVPDWLHGPGPWPVTTGCHQLNRVLTAKERGGKCQPYTAVGANDAVLHCLELIDEMVREHAKVGGGIQLLNPEAPW